MTLASKVQLNKQMCKPLWDKALQELDNEYEGRVKEALQERAANSTEAWKAHSDRLEKAWKMYSRETG